MQILGTSREYVLIGVDAPARAGDITGYPVQAALVPDDGREPAEGDWQPAIWIGGEAALLVGPDGDVDYPPGEYMAFARVTAGAERPVMKSGRVRVGNTGS